MIKTIKKRTLLLIILTVFAPTSQVVAEDNYQKHPKNYTVKEAYEFFGHERTPFNKNTTTIPENEAKYLDHLFFSADLAMQARVNMMQYYFAGANTHKKFLPVYLKTMEEITQGFTLTRAPTKDLKDVQDLFLLALGEQQNFFIKWSNLRGNAFMNMRSNFQKDELVISSHTKLQRVYMQLMLLYPNETTYNQKAFYNHLCALDFI